MIFNVRFLDAFKQIMLNYFTLKIHTSFTLPTTHQSPRYSMHTATTHGNKTRQKKKIAPITRLNYNRSKGVACENK